MKNYKLISLIVYAVFFISCSKMHTYKVSGVINEDVRDDLLRVNFPKIEIDISSPGGKAGSSIEIAEFLINKNVHFNVRNICNSACSQILLPVADSIDFVDNPLIGFHWSLISDVEYFTQNGGDLSQCKTLESLYIREKAILAHNDLNQEFWKEIDKRLVQKNFKFIRYEDDVCSGYDYDFKHFMWYPTSQQMRKLFGLKFNGFVCADDYVACGRKIDAIAASEGARKDVSIIIGDKVHIIKGQ